MAHLLLLYSSNYGLSRKICERLQARLMAAGHVAEVAPLADHPLELKDFDGVVIGASIRHGKHSPAVLEYIRAHAAELAAMPSALFSVNLVARKPGKDTPAGNPYLQALLAQSPWKPDLLGVFAGELDYARYDAVNRQLMRLVMWINHGPTDPRTKVQFTKWEEVDRYAAQLATLVTTRRAAPQPLVRDEPVAA